MTAAHSRIVTGMVAALAAVSVFTDFFEVGWPLKSGALIVAVAVAYWLLRRQLPTLKDILIAVLLAVTGILGLAWLDTRGEEANLYDFVVIPKDVVTVESAFPGPRREARDSGLYGYGEHVWVRCGAIGYDDKVWYALSNGNFMPGDELVPAALTDEEPPSC